MAFRWRADDGPTLNAGLVALWFFRGSGPVLLKKPWFFVIFQGIQTPCPPLDPHVSSEQSAHTCHQGPEDHSCRRNFQHFQVQPCADAKRGGDRGSGPPPWKITKKNNIGFNSNTGPDPLKITKLPIQHLMLSNHRWWIANSCVWILPPPPHQTKKTRLQSMVHHRKYPLFS